MTDRLHERVLILDFGAQYAQLIARRVREQNVLSEIVRPDISTADVRAIGPRGIILSGGPSSVYDRNAPRCDPKIFDLGIPILGICYGMQLLCQAHGGRVEGSDRREFGRATCQIQQADPLWNGLPREFQVWMSHGDSVTGLDDMFMSLGATSTCPHAAVRHREYQWYGLQFHPEVTHTPLGGILLRNFVREICGCRGDWTMENFAQTTIDDLRLRIGTDRVICGLSGGVDSAVAAALLSRAIGPQLVCILVDNGLLRGGERELVHHEFTSHFQTDLRIIDAESRFLAALAGVTEPQEKRRRIGHTFIECFREAAQGIANAKYLAQGTLYPDVIESGAARHGSAATIKLHHNVGGLPDELGFELVEPLRELFKDEVRGLGLELGLPEAIVWRHPFPGPGLGVRCIGEVTKERLDVLRAADTILLEEIRNADLYRQISQAFAVLLPVQSVGVMGDARTYENTVVIRCVETDDFMTADWSHLPYDLLGRISTRIINEVRGVNRVAYDISSKPPATIEWE